MPPVRQNALADMPTFPRVEIKDGSEDWQYEHDPSYSGPYVDNSSGKQIIFGLEPASRTDCRVYDPLSEEEYYPIPDIASISFLSNSKTLNSTVWLSGTNKTSIQYDSGVGQQFNNHSVSQSRYSIYVLDNQNKSAGQIVSEQLKFLKESDPSFHLYENESEIGTLDNDMAHKRLVFLHQGEPSNNTQTGDQCETCKVMEYLVTKDNRLYIILYVAGVDEFDTFIEPIIAMTDSVEFSDGYDLDPITTTYENGSFRIKFDYPSNWLTNTKPIENTRESNVMTLYHPDSNSSIRVLVDNKIFGITDLTLDNYLQIIKDNTKIDPTSKIVTSNTDGKLGYEDAYNLTYTYLENGISRKALEVGAKVGDDKIYKVQYYSDLKDYTKDLPDVQNLIESFQFDVDLLTYDNDTLGLRMQYPYNWVRGDEIGSPFGFMSESFIGGVGYYSPVRGPYMYHEGYSMIIGYDSIYGRQTPYAISLTKNSSGSNWIRNITEFPLQGSNEVTIFNDNNFSNSSLQRDYVKINVDPASLSLPDNFLAYHFKNIAYLIDGKDCVLTDYTDYTSIPPPQYTLTMEPNSIIDLRPGDEKNIRIILNSLTNLPFKVSLLSANSSGVESRLVHGLTSGVPEGNTTSYLKIRILPNAEPKTYTIPVTANIVFDPTINLENTTSARVTEKSTISVTVLPPKSMREHLDDIASWLSPLNSVWVFLTAIAAVMSPIIVRLYKMWKREKKIVD